MTPTNLIRLASFADGDKDGLSGGNPAGVHLSSKLPSAAEMQAIAAEVGYSETVFAAPLEPGWRVRYFSPESEVPFCGHATIALGAALAMRHGAAVYSLQLNGAEITVEGFIQATGFSAALQSPPTWSRASDRAMISEALALFGYTRDDLDEAIPPAFANAGASHLIVGLKSRAALGAIDYRLDDGRVFMKEAGVVTVMFVVADNEQHFHCRNAFASGGVLEDPATGSAAAAFAGYLRDIQWPHLGGIEIVQGEDMGARSVIKAEIGQLLGSSVRVSGAVRLI